MAAARPKKSKRRQETEKEAAQVEEDDDKPGCVYLGHIPHGFFEEEMKEYFGQFGQVLNVKICRSKKTANSKGYGFVKFRYAAVAKTVAETCNNYLFYNKLLKCHYKPMSEMHRETFRSYSIKPKTAPRRQYNSTHTEEKMAQVIQRSVSRAQKKLERLKAIGLNAELSGIMDVPEVPVVEKKAKKKVVTKSDKTTKDKKLSRLEHLKKKKKADRVSTPKTNDKVLTDSESNSKSPKKKKKVSQPSRPKTNDAELSKPKTPPMIKKTVARLPAPKTKEPSQKRKKVSQPSTPKTVDTELSTSESPPKKRMKLSPSSTPSGQKKASTPKSQKVKNNSTSKSPLLKKSPNGKKSGSPKVVTPKVKGKRLLKK